MLTRVSITRKALLATALAVGGTEAHAQGPTVTQERPSPPGGTGSDLGPSPGTRGSRLGAAPGEGASPFGNAPGQGADVLGGRPGTSTPRVSPPGPQPAGGTTPRSVITPPATLPIAELPLYGPLEVPNGEDQDGPADGLTLDAAIERLVRTNLDLRSKFFEIPQAQADILSASLRANPILYADSQLIPYGGFSKVRPGGPTQYDVNVTLPLDVSRKRQARTLVASKAKRVLEAQYQDAVRVQIDNLYRAFVDVLAARETVRYARTSLAGSERLLSATRSLKERDLKTDADVGRIEILRDSAEIAVSESEGALRDAKRVLAGLLVIPPEQADTLELRGTIREVAPAPPPEEVLIPQALASRPDLVAYRFGIDRAQADVRLAKANRLSDIYLLYQPYTFQNNAPFQAKSAHSWALGVTVPLPITNRNQGNIRRAELNVGQSLVELSAQEKVVIAEVRRAMAQYTLTKQSVDRLERKLLPTGRKLVENSRTLFQSGEGDVVAYLNAQRDNNEVVRQYRDTSVRHRRSMLNLNTAVGLRLLP